MGLLDEKTWLVEPVWTFLLTRRFDIIGIDGSRIGDIEGTSVDLDVRAVDGNLVASFERPWKIFRVSVHILDAERKKIGSIVQITPMGRIRFEIRDSNDVTTGSMSPTESWAFGFEVSIGSKVIATVSRKYRFFRTGSYGVEFREGADHAMKLLTLGGIVALDKTIDGRRSSSAAPIA